MTARRTGTDTHDGLNTYVYTATRSAPATDRPAVLTYEQAATLNGGRLPLGVRPAGRTADATIHAVYVETTTTTLWVDPRTASIIDLRWADTTRATFVGTPVGDVPLDKPVASTVHTLPAATAQAAARSARHDLAAAARHDGFVTGAWLSGGVAGLGLACATWLAAAGRPGRGPRVTHVTADRTVSPSTSVQFRQALPH